MKLYRELNEQEKEESRKWARKNYKPLDPIPGIWHPIVQEECVRMNWEHNFLPEGMSVQEAINEILK